MEATFENLVNYVRENKTFDEHDIARAYKLMDRMRCPLWMADENIANEIADLANEFCEENGIEQDDLLLEHDAGEVFDAL